MEGLFPISLIQIALGMVQHTAQIPCAVDGAADALQRAGADEACRFADEENALFSFAEIPKGGGAQNQTSLCFQGLAKAEADLFQLLFLLLKACSGVVQRECTAEDELMVFGNRPGAAIGGLRVEDAGIEGGGVGFREPLLDGKIVPNLLLGIKGSADDGICPVGTHKAFCCAGVGFSLGRVRSKDASAFWASPEMSPPQGFWKPSPPKTFLSMAMILYFGDNSRANVEPAGPRPMMAIS